MTGDNVIEDDDMMLNKDDLVDKLIEKLWNILDNICGYKYETEKELLEKLNMSKKDLK